MNLFSRKSKVAAGLGVLLVVVAFSMSAVAEPIPRLLLAGDSWTGFLLAFRSFRSIFPEYGLERWVEVGNRTAEMGGRVWEMLERNYLQILTEELTRYPNIDIVVMTLGGNDIMRGVKGVDPRPGYQNRTVSLRTCFESNPANEPWEDFNQCMEWVANKLEEQIGVIVDHILSIRPDIRVVILSYDYAAREPREGYTIEDQHLAFINVEMAKRSLALARPRVEYVNNFGLMQHLYGIPEENIEPGVAPYPCDAPEDPDCTFWPGGFPQYLSPLMAYIDQDIHLTDFGYAAIARRAVEKYIQEWLNYPKVLQILPLNNKAPLYQFRVTFSHPVNGVTLDDFEIYVNTKSGLKAKSVISVVPTSGPADTYTVTVDMDGSQQVAYIRVLDNDSITRADTGIPLGGPGVGNGFFEYNGTYEFQDIPQAGDEDFAGALQFLYMASQAYEHLLGQYGFSFNPQFFDANGDFLRDGSLTEPYVIPGNGLLDLYEFMVLDAILKRPDLDFSARGGATYTAVRAAWDSNIASVQAALGGIGGLADIILPGLDTLLAGFLTIGDHNSIFLVQTLVQLLGAIDEFPTNLNPSMLPEYDPFNLNGDIYLRRWLALNGDVDGDGWNNDKEYAYFAVDGVAAYVNAVLNPAIIPKTGEGRYNFGDSVRIALLDRPKYNSTFQWYRNGVPVSAKDPRIRGANSRTLEIVSLVPEDAGNYTCVYRRPSPSNAITTYGPITIFVREGPVPVVNRNLLLVMLITLSSLGAVLLDKKARLTKKHKECAGSALTKK